MGSFMKKVCATVVALAMAFVVLPISEISSVFAISLYWDGTADAAWASGYTDNADTTAETFTISTAEQLAQLAAKVNSGLSFTGKTINLTADIVLNDTTGWENWGTTPPANSWTAIGHKTIELYEYPFSGTFDGNGHTVSGIYINKTVTNVTSDYQGLFGISRGTIKNVGVVNGYIKGYNIVSGIVGKNDSTGRMENCYNSATITTIQNHAGGVAGNNLGILSNCYNTGTVSGLNYIGGISGYAQYATTTNCYNTGTINASVNNSGGLVGQLWGGTLSNCYNTGAVSATGSNIGGVVGQAADGGTITNSYYYNYKVGIGGTNASQTGTTPFVKITDNPIVEGNNTTITEQDTADINTALTSAFGADFNAEFTGAYSSSDTGVATISGTTITGVSAGNANISGRTLTITQNALTSTGFDGAPEEIQVNISLPLSVTVLPFVPTVTTQGTSDITQTTATLNGNITNLGSPNPTMYGLCWNTSGNPTTSDSKTNKGAANATGTFASEITGLTPNTTYYVRAYATNSSGTSYGAMVSFATSAPTISYTVAFNSNGGSVVSSITNVSSGSTISKPTDPTKYGYTFDGWYKEIGLTNAWDFANDTVTATITLYAKWTPILPTITIPSNITLNVGDKLSGITARDAGYIYFVKSGETATSYEDLTNLQTNGLAEQLNYMSINPTDKIDVSLLDLGVYDIYVVNVPNFLIAKSDKTLTITSPYTKGSGTEKDPYWVTNVVQLRAMQAFQNTSFILKNDISLAHIPNWEPIYFAYNKLDGNYHNITGLNVDTSGSSKEIAGLFSMVYFSEVKHLGIINANVKGVFAAGILAGNVYDSHIEEVYTTGTVEGVRNVGGLIGMYTLAIATVENCYSTATVKGEDYVGGLVGGMEESSIINSYSAGQVIVQDSSSSSGFGGFLGADNPTGKVEKANIFVANYYDKQTSGQSDSIGATGKTTAEMKTKSTFLAGSGEQVWDFTNVWAISPTYNNGYPYLKGFYTAPTKPTKPISPIPSTPDDPKTIVVVEAPAGINNADKITVEPIGEAFDESVEVRIKNDADVKKLIEDFIKSDGKINLENANVFPLDISLYLKGTDTKVQPNNGTSVKITCPIPESLLAEKDNIKVVCVIDGKLIVLETKVILIDGVWCVQFTANHFSPYAIVVDKDNALSNEKTSENAENTPTPNPVTGENTVLPISFFAILSVATLGVVIKKRKFKVVKRA